MAGNKYDYAEGWQKEQEKTEWKKKIAKNLGTRTDKINVTSVVTDNGGASVVKFTWARNCDTYISIVSALGAMQLYRQV